MWFDEARRAHLWDTVLSDDERTAIGQMAYTTLLRKQQAGDDALAGSGLTGPIAKLARYARDSQAANPKLKQLIDFSDDELAVLAAAIELEGTGIASPTPADQLVIHAHTAFGARRAQALEALPTLSDHGLLQMTHVGTEDATGTSGRSLPAPAASVGSRGPGPTDRAGSRRRPGESGAPGSQ